MGHHAVIHEKSVGRVSSSWNADIALRPVLRVIFSASPDDDPQTVTTSLDSTAPDVRLPAPLSLTADERAELERRVRSRKSRPEDARRARVILLLTNGASFGTIAETVGCYPDYINRWKHRFESERLAGLRSKYSGQRAPLRTRELEARVLARTRQHPPNGGHWTTRKLAKALGISHTLVARIWRRAGLYPGSSEHHRLSDDPEFERKATDIVGVYLNPPQHAFVFATDGRAPIRVLGHVEPLSSASRAERAVAAYPLGTAALYAALDAANGEIHGHSAAGQGSGAFVAFLTDVVSSEARRREIHVVVDHLALHQTKGLKKFLAEHPRLYLHLTPSHEWWLNQVGLWIAKAERDLLACGAFDALPDLPRKIRRFMRRYRENPKPVRWASDTHTPR
jgi:transposase